MRFETEENENLVQYVYNDNKEIVTELKENDSKRYVRGYELICSECYQTRNYYHYASDERGSITHVLENGKVRNFYEYDAFGNISNQYEEVENIFKYAGEKFDQVTNQYYLRARYYNPVIGRFTQQDTYHGDGLNLYSYVANNPVKYVDPSGHEKTDLGNDIEKEKNILHNNARHDDFTCYGETKKYVEYLKVSDFLKSELKYIGNTSHIYEVKHNGNKIILTTRPTNTYEIADIVSLYSDPKNEIIILSGSHGDEMGYSGLGAKTPLGSINYNDVDMSKFLHLDFYDKDVKTIERIRYLLSPDINAQVIDIGDITPKGLEYIINGSKIPFKNRNRVVIAAYCYSERSIPIINAITKSK